MPRPAPIRAHHAALVAIAIALAVPAAAEIETLVVTAQKRESTLQKTNISITALTAQDLDARGVVRVNDLTEYIPNVNFQPNSNGNGFFVATRGIAQADATNITRDPATAIYIDGVYWGMTIGNLIDVLDIQRIEALRGPQGDLYGRNAVAGAVNIVTRKPSGDVGHRSSVRGGTKRRGDIRIYQEFPLYSTDSFSIAGNMGFASINRDAYFQNDVDEDVFSENRYALRTALSAEAGAFNGTFVLDYSAADEQGAEMQLTSANTSGFLIARPEQIAVLNGGAGGFNRARATKLNLDGPSTTGNGLRNDETRNLGVSFTGTYGLDDVPVLGNLELKSITGYRSVYSNTSNDRDGTSVDIFSGNERVDQWQVTEELSMVGNRSGPLGSLDYILGFFLFHEEGDLTNFQSADGLTFVPQVTQPSIENDAYAVYTHLAYIPPIWEDRIKAEFGIRYTFEERYIEQFASGTFGTFRGSATEAFDQVTPSGRLSLQVIDPLTLYASITSGFLSGGFNGRATALGSGSPADLERPYDAEELVSYEGGFKFQGFEDRVRLNVAGYWVDYTDLQRTSIFFGPGGAVQSFVLNADEAELWGIELELLLNPLEELYLNFAYGWADTKYNLYCDFAPFGGGTPNASCPTLSGTPQADFSKQRNFANTPQHNVSVGAQYTVPLSWTNVTGRLDYYWQSETVLQNGTNPLAGEDSYGLLHARLTLGDIQLPGDFGSIDAALWGRNLLDEEYRPFGIDFASYVVQTFGERRTYGMEFTYRFGSML